MVNHTSFALSNDIATIHKHAKHVLITDYLISTNKTTNETIEEEHNVIAVSPNDHRWYR